ncbi:MAG: pilus assembly protein [Rubrivivax sp.]|nr:pilus assembly protein [Rubrivivax sp.]
MISLISHRLTGLARRWQLALRLRQGMVSGLTALLATGALATTPLSDQPVFATASVPGNLALALSVEFPTAVSVAHTNNTFNSAETYLGYFDPNKCYLYQWSSTEADRHFAPAGAASNRICTGTDDSKWSGNFLNWATMQTVDPFRWVLTGGYRSTDTASVTLLEKAWASGQGGTGNFPDRTLSTASVVPQVSPFSWSQFRMRIQGLGNKMHFTNTGDVYNSPTEYKQGMAVSNSTTYEVSIRIKVCDTSTGAGPLEDNCTRYPAGNYKPTGLLQAYADQIRYSAFGYLNDSDLYRDGGVLRARQKFVGPTAPVPGALPASNAGAEWDASTGVFIRNPDTSDATATSSAYGVTVSDSGVINYLNKFGQITPGTYKTYDNVSEMYYAALRYFKKQGNVPEWTNMSGADTNTRRTWIDGFPVITNWDDPIQYSCQRNFILGIGDVNTHADRNLPGASGGREPSKPAAVSNDTSVNALTATNKIGQLHGIGNIGNTQGYGGCCNDNGALLAGLAYDANTQDIRPDDPADLGRTKGRQSVQTYWLDVLEYQTYKNNNQYYMATKYGGFNVPESFDAYSRATDIPESWWRTNTDLVGSQPRPDTYFIASRPDQIVKGLSQAFASIASRLKAFTTSFATSLPQIATSGLASFATQYDARTWTGELTANTTSIDTSTGAPSLSEAWRFSAKLDAQAAGTGWNTGRLMASWNDSTKTGVAFRLANLSATQQSALDTSYRSGADGGDYLNYLRGDRTHERSSTASGSAKAYRDRSGLVGDIGNFKARPVGRPDAPYSSSSNPGYGTFKSSWATRPTVVYVGTNAGVLHAVNGSLSGAQAGRELFAYVPGALFAGPSATPATNGLQAVGNPNFQHYNFIDATPAVADVDLGRTVGGSGTDWRTLLIGGLGKGGRALYALDITDPGSITTEAQAASRVLWEFTDPDLGFTYGEPAVVKTRKHGWVVIVGSGYNNANGRGYLFIINPRTGALLEKIDTGAGNPANQAGLAHIQAFILDRTDGTADSVYAGDLLGNLWRWDLTATSGSLPAPLLMAHLRDGSGNPLSVTARPLVVVHPDSGLRYVTVGTGRLLHSSDASSSQVQRYFAYVDGNGARFGASNGSQLPSGVSFPIQTSKLKQLTDLTKKAVIDLNTQAGWFVDFGAVAGGGGWRMISDATSFYGVVAFSIMQPGGVVNPCEPTGNSRVYAIDLGSGQSRLQAGGSTAPFLATLPGIVTDLRFYSAAGKARLLAGTDTGGTDSLQGGWGTAGSLRRLNWREVILND